MKNQEASLLRVGDLVWWLQGECESPGLVLEVKPAREATISDCSITASGKVALIMLQELNGKPTWMHECEVEKLNTI